MAILVAATAFLRLFVEHAGGLWTMETAVQQCSWPACTPTSVEFWHPEKCFLTQFLQVCSVVPGKVACMMVSSKEKL